MITLDRTDFRAAFPQAPWLHLYRAPAEVMVSHARSRGMQMVPQVVAPAVFGLAQPAIFKAQMRALLRAAVDGDLRVMFPFVSSVQEVRAARAVFGFSTFGMAQADPYSGAFLCVNPKFCTLTGRSGCGAPPLESLEQFGAEFFLQIEDAAVHRRRGDVQVIRGLAD